MEDRSDHGTHNPTRRFLGEIIALVTVAMVVAMVAVYVRTSTLVNDAALSNARSYADLVMTTRSWNAGHGGVWVLKGPGVATNPYLKDFGVSADATTTDGRVLTLRNPSLMTKEIAELIKRSDGTSFRMTSLKPLDPENAPDAWERVSMIAFETGTAESWASTRVSGVSMFRYMRPLITDASCLQCHARQGYRIGDVRGAISVFVPLATSEAQSAVNAGLVGGFGIIATLIMLAVTLALVRRMRAELDRAQAALVEAATVDVLTGAATRRETMLRLQAEIGRAARTHEPIALVMIDIDHFKRVNDEHGHAAGDTVLAEVSHRIGDTLRPYDVFGRVGGEEFLIVAPGTGLDEAAAIAERARSAISSGPMTVGTDPVDVTVSLGVTVVDPAEEDALDHALARADEALYDAKDNGRNRTSVSSPIG